MYFGRWFHFYMDINNLRLYAGIIAKCCKESAHCELTEDVGRQVKQPSKLNERSNPSCEVKVPVQ